MEVRQITPQVNIKLANQKYKSSPNITQNEGSTTELSSYPKSYYINFGARKIDNQDIINGAPYEVERCLKSIQNDSRYQELISRDDGLYTIHQKVYGGLKECRTTEDVKRKFPGFTDEFGKQRGTFVNLLPLKKVKSPKAPLVRNLKEIDSKGIQILKNGEEVPVYLLKKLLLEGKSYKDTMSELEKDLTSEAKSRMNIEISGHAEVLKDFGVIMPDGTNYMHTLRASANPTETMKLLDSIMQSQELTERIPRALESDDPRVRISMIYAWNQCPDIREDLSKFLHYNLDNPAFLVESPECDIYSSNFHRKMSVVMKAFWKDYPEHNAKLSEEITKAYAEYDKHAKTPEELNKFIKETERKSNEIRALIQSKFETEREHKIGKELLLFISKAICDKNPHISNFINDEFKFDFYKLLLKNTTNKELKILEGDKDSKEFQRLIKTEIPKKANQVKNGPDYRMLMQVQKIAYLEAYEENLGTTEEINALYTLDDEDTSKLFEFLKKGSKVINLGELSLDTNGIRMINIVNSYNAYKQPVGSRAKYIEEAVINSIPSGSADEEKVKSLISRYPQMLLELRNEELPSEKQRALLDGFWEVYDMENGTDCQGEFKKGFDLIKSQKEKEEIQFDFECDDLIGEIF